MDLPNRSEGYWTTRGFRWTLFLIILILITLEVSEQALTKKSKLKLLKIRWKSLNEQEKQTVKKQLSKTTIQRNGSEITTGNRLSPSKTVQQRSHGYNSNGYNGGGGGNYLYQNGGHMMYFSNFDTALTTLAFLSFGVFLLNMIFSFLDLGPPSDLGNPKRRRRAHLHPGPFAPITLIALSSLQHKLTNELATEDRLVCNFNSLCPPHSTTLQQQLRDHLKPLIASMLK